MAGAGHVVGRGGHRGDRAADRAAESIRPAGHRHRGRPPAAGVGEALPTGGRRDDRHHPGSPDRRSAGLRRQGPWTRRRRPRRERSICARRGAGRHRRPALRDDPRPGARRSAGPPAQARSFGACRAGTELFRGQEGPVPQRVEAHRRGRAGSGGHPAGIGRGWCPVHPDRLRRDATAPDDLLAGHRRPGPRHAERHLLRPAHQPRGGPRLGADRPELRDPGRPVRRLPRRAARMRSSCAWSTFN